MVVYRWKCIRVYRRLDWDSPVESICGVGILSAYRSEVCLYATATSAVPTYGRWGHNMCEEFHHLRRSSCCLTPNDDQESWCQRLETWLIFYPCGIYIAMFIYLCLLTSTYSTILSSGLALIRINWSHSLEFAARRLFGKASEFRWLLLRW